MHKIHHEQSEILFLLVYSRSVSGIMVSIAAFQAVDPGSIPGWRSFFPSYFLFSVEVSYTIEMNKMLFYNLLQGASIIIQALPYLMKFIFECSFMFFSNRDVVFYYIWGRWKKLALNVMKVIFGYPLFQHPQTRGEWIYYIQVDSNYTAIF